MIYNFNVLRLLYSTKSYVSLVLTKAFKTFGFVEYHYGFCIDLVNLSAFILKFSLCYVNMLDAELLKNRLLLMLLKVSVHSRLKADLKFIGASYGLHFINFLTRICEYSV